jgi:thiamine monophosphate synthase
MRKIDTTLYLVTNSTGRSEEEFLRILEEACAAGVT